LFGAAIWGGLIAGPILVIIGALMRINKEEPEADLDGRGT
jgi:hypothetical protein